MSVIIAKPLYEIIGARREIARVPGDRLGVCSAMWAKAQLRRQSRQRPRRLLPGLHTHAGEF